MIPFELLFFVGALLLFGAIIYGVLRDKTRDKRNDAITEAATKEQYEHPERYQHTQDLFEKAATRDDHRPQP
jgi:hypothetical protein